MTARRMRDIWRPHAASSEMLFVNKQRDRLRKTWQDFSPCFYLFIFFYCLCSLADSLQRSLHDAPCSYITRYTRIGTIISKTVYHCDDNYTRDYNILCLFVLFAACSVAYTLRSWCSCRYSAKNDFNIAQPKEFVRYFKSERLYFGLYSEGCTCSAGTYYDIRVNDSPKYRLETWQIYIYIYDTYLSQIKKKSYKNTVHKAKYSRYVQGWICYNEWKKFIIVHNILKTTLSFVFNFMKLSNF